jgi:hypothetical protein
MQTMILMIWLAVVIPASHFRGKNIPGSGRLLIFRKEKGGKRHKGRTVPKGTV